MKNYPIKLTTLAISVFSSFYTYSALYKIVEVSPPSSLTYGTDYKSSFGTAIESSASGVNCFSGTDCYSSDTPSYILSGETRYQKTMAGQPVDGVSFKEEVPFSLYNDKDDDTSGHSIYIGDDEDYFSNYCSDQLGYNTCSYWADVFYAERHRELAGSTVTAFPFIQDTSAATDDIITSTLSLGMSSSTLKNSVVTGTTSSESYGFTLSFGSSDKRTTITPNPLIDSSYTRARAFKTKTYNSVTLTAGSVASAYGSDNKRNTTKASVWLASGTPVEIAWSSSTAKASNNDLAQGSIRDFTSDGTNYYAVGYNSYDSSYNFMKATVFTATVSGYATAGNWTSTAVSGADVSSSSSSVYSNTKLTAVNDNLIAIGESKYDSSHSSNGSRSNKLFVVADVSATTPTATYFSDGTGNIGFTGAGGHANAINNNNDIVGQIDTETAREVNGKPRRKRGFIYPYNDTTNGSSIFNDQAWILDDLTNGGDESSANNAYRILSANDINDAGVIAATAIKCDGGYDSTAHDATCGGGNTTETTVAVQLIPIEGATSSDISSRSYSSSTESVSRQGASSGVFSLFGLLGLLMFRRKK